MRLYTIGHSNRTLDAFLDLLARNQIEVLVDVRAFPHSRTQPQFDQPALSAALHAQGLAYRHLPALGGRRGRSCPDSPNVAWRVEGFRNYADYMASEVFAAGLAELEAIATDRRTAIMCAEALPWRCHRRLIADCLIAKGHEVYDILSAAPPRPHQLPAFAVKAGPCVLYPGNRHDS